MDDRSADMSMDHTVTDATAAAPAATAAGSSGGTFAAGGSSSATAAVTAARPSAAAKSLCTKPQRNRPLHDKKPSTLMRQAGVVDRGHVDVSSVLTADQVTEAVQWLLQLLAAMPAMREQLVRDALPQVSQRWSEIKLNEQADSHDGSASGSKGAASADSSSSSAMTTAPAAASASPPHAHPADHSSAGASAASSASHPSASCASVPDLRAVVQARQPPKLRCFVCIEVFTDPHEVIHYCNTCFLENGKSMEGVLAFHEGCRSNSSWKIPARRAQLVKQHKEMDELQSENCSGLIDEHISKHLRLRSCYANATFGQLIAVSQPEADRQERSTRAGDAARQDHASAASSSVQQSSGAVSSGDGASSSSAALAAEPKDEFLLAAPDHMSLDHRDHGRSADKAACAVDLLSVAASALRAMLRMCRGDLRSTLSQLNKQTALFVQNQLAAEKLQPSIDAVTSLGQRNATDKAALRAKWLAPFPGSKLCELIASELTQADFLDYVRNCPRFRFRIAWVAFIMHVARELLLDGSGLGDRLLEVMPPTVFDTKLDQLPEFEQDELDRDRAPVPALNFESLHLAEL